MTAAGKFKKVIFNLCIPDHDAGVFHTPEVEDAKFGDRVTSALLDGFRRWDAQYFLHIAQFGYTYENALAFFPLFPILLDIVFYILYTVLSYALNIQNCLLLIGVIVNVLFFILSAIFLYSLTLQVFKSMSVAYTSTLLFCINPASIFFSSLYSESLFSLLTFAGLFFLEKQNHSLALACLSLSCSTRSNGILFLGFIIHSELKVFLSQYLSIRACSFSESCVYFIIIAGRLLFKGVIFFVPFIMYQMYSFLLFCKSHTLANNLPLGIIEHAEKHGYKVYGDPPSEWCYWKIPVSYSYVQSHYWNVGFLQYYEIKQIPNFLLALPLFVIIVSAITKYCQKNFKLICNLGLLKVAKHKFTLYGNEKCFIYFTHAGVLTVICIFFIHIQVSTRLFASSSPVLYWIAASLITHGHRHHFFDDESANDSRNFIKTASYDLYYLYHCATKSSIYAKLIFYYFSLYFLLGILLHVNYLPWT